MGVVNNQWSRWKRARGRRGSCDWQLKCP